MPTIKRTFVRSGVALISDVQDVDYGTVEDFERYIRAHEGEPDEREYVIADDGSHLRITYHRAGITTITEYHP